MQCSVTSLTRTLGLFINILPLMPKRPRARAFFEEYSCQPAHQTGATLLKCLKMHTLYRDSGRASHTPPEIGVSCCFLVFWLCLCCNCFLLPSLSTKSCMLAAYVLMFSLSPESCTDLSNYAVDQMSAT